MPNNVGVSARLNSGRSRPSRYGSKAVLPDFKLTSRLQSFANRVVGHKLFCRFCHHALNFNQQTAIGVSMQPMKYPASLHPTTTETMTLPSSGLSTAVPKATPTFAKWQGKPVDDDYNGKPILDFDGSPAFAELVILRTLESAGWQGVWVDTYRSAFRTESWESVSQKSLPQKPSSLPQGIWDLAKIRAGVLGRVLLARRQSPVLRIQASKKRCHPGKSASFC